MIVDDFHLFSALPGPTEAKTILLVDSNAVLSFIIAGKGFQAIAGWTCQIVKTGGGMEDEQFGSRPPADIRREHTGGETIKEFFRFFA